MEPMSSAKRKRHQRSLVSTQWEGSRLRARKRVLVRDHIRQHLNLDPAASGTGERELSVVKPPACGICFVALR